jgi:predicted amidohydrolase YtcJ
VTYGMKGIAIIMGLLLAGVFPGQTARLPRGAELILVNGKIWTGELMMRAGRYPGPARFVGAMAISNGRILATGTTAQIQSYNGPGTEVIDLGQHFAMPGFVDDHAHFMAGSFQLLEVNLKHTSSEAEFTARVAEKVKTMPAGRWLQGGNWDEENWPDTRLPTRQMIDSVTPHNPAFLSRYDGHAALANSLALKLAGIDNNTPDPTGGVIVRDAQTGEPTGVLKDAAEDLVGRVIPPPSDAEMEEALRTGLAEARRVGVTSVQDITMGGDSPTGGFNGEIRLLRRAESEGWLTCRFYAITPVAEWQKLAAAGISHGMGSEWLRMGAVKAFSDGSLGSRTAWMFQPYTDDVSNYGLATALMQPPSRMESILQSASQAGLQTAVHAIGDRANATMLDIYTAMGGNNPAEKRFRIEHAQHVRPQDFERFARLGIIASMQPYHAIDDGRWAEKRIGHERAATSYAWRTMLQAGVPLAFGTDWPVAPLNPLLGIYAAVTRATLDGKNPNGWFPEQRLTVDQSLRAYTQGSAFAEFSENEKGTLAPGKLADVVELSDNPFTVAPEAIKDIHVLRTIVGGEAVYQAH